MLKCHSWYVPQQEQVLLGLPVNGVGMPGGEEVVVYLRVSMCRKASGPAPAPQDLHSLPESGKFAQSLAAHCHSFVEALCK